MTDKKKTVTPGKPQSFKAENGVWYFTRELERKIFFILTLAMLVAGALAKMGLF